MRKLLVLAAALAVVTMGLWAVPPPAQGGGPRIALTKGEPVVGGVQVQPAGATEAAGWALSIAVKPTVLFRSGDSELPVVVTNPKSAQKSGKLRVDFLDSSNSSKMSSSLVTLPLNPGGNPFTLVVPGWMTAQAGHLGLTKLQVVLLRSGSVKASDSSTIDYDLSASIQADFPSGSAPLHVSFAAVVSGGDSPYTFDWDFGDTAPHASGPTTSHTYLYPGDFTAIVHVTDQIGGTATATLPVHVASAPFSATCSAAPSTGQLPLAVAFNATPAGGTGDYTFDWNFGDGSAHSSLQNPNHTYTSVGTFTATVTVGSQGQTVTCSSTVTVYSPLAVTCSVTPHDGPAPLSAQFSAAPTGGTGTYTYDWDFGDGGAHATTQAPTHIYQAGGTYTATVRVTSGYQQSTCTQVVTVAYAPIVITASASPLSGAAPLDVAFTASATGGNGGYSWSWDFGDGATSATQNPTHTYASVGLYTARLTVLATTGQSATWVQAITVNSSGFDVIVTASPTTGPAPLSTTFTATPSGGTAPYTYRWNFGDSATGSVQNPMHTYTSAGTYAPNLTVTDGAGKQAFWSGAITATYPALNLNAAVSPLEGSAPLTVSCTSAPTGGNGSFTYLWNFGDGSTSTAQNPSHTFTHTGMYNVALTVNSGDQSGSWSQVVVANSDGMSVIVSTSPSVGSAPLIVNFVSTVSGGYTPLTYAWEFGDGNTSADANPTHVYQDPGTYAPRLTVTDAFGRQAFWNGSVTVNFPALTVQATAHPSQGPPPLNVTFTAQAYGGNGFYTYHWDFGDGSVPSPNQNTTHTYGLVGLYTAVLTVTSGTQTVTWSHAIMVNSAGFSVEVTADPNYQVAPMTSTFTANILGGTAPFTYSWIFGDPGSGANDFSTLASPSHTYTNPGTYTALLNVVDSDGRQAFGACAVVALNPSLSVTGTATPSHGPAPLTVAFSCTASGGAGGPYTYSWDFGDGSPADPSQNPSHTYTHTGVYPANVTVTDDLSQTATWAVSILVDSEGFSVTVQATPSIGYYPLTVNFAATPTGGTAPYTYAWNFGDPASGANNTSTLPTPSHTYNAAGSYTVILLLTDANGMQCTWMGSITVQTPELYVTCGATPNEVAIGTPVAFSAQGHGGDGTYVYTWDFGDGTLPVVAQATTHAYGSAGNFTASVAVTSAGQTAYCYKTILVHDPALTVVATASPRLVAPLQGINFTATPSGGNGTYTYWWDFGDGFTSTLQNPSHGYNGVGMYTVNLTVTSAFQRAYWATTIYVQNPQLCITATGLPTEGTRPLTVLFSTTICNPSGDPPYHYYWDTGDNTPSSDISSFNHQYTTAGLYNWYVKLTDSAVPSPHVAYSYGTVLVNDPALVVTCSANPTEVAVGDTVTFQATSAGGNGVSYLYQWVFGDGHTASGYNLTNVTNAYSSPGTYTATVTVTSGTQVSTCYCVVLVHAPPLNLSVQMTPLPSWINVNQPGILAAGNQVLFTPNATGGDGTKPYNYHWSFGDGSTDTVQFPPAHTYTNPGLYTVNVVVTNGFQQANWTSTILVNSPQLTVPLTVTPTSGVRTLTVTATPAPAGGTPPYTYTYIWGDSQPNGSGAPPQTHPYTTAGTFTLVTRVDDAAAHTAFAYQAITVTDPPLSVTCSANPKIVAVGGNVNFTSAATGGTGSYTYAWDFGDGVGTAATQNATYAYTASGVYTATVTVTSGTQVQKCYCVILVNDTSMGLTMVMTPNPGWANGQVGRIFTNNSVNFNALPTGGTGSYTYAWDFGDTGTSTLNPTGNHQFTAPGIYTVNLKVTSGTATYYWAQTIAVSDPALGVTVAMTPNPGWLNGQTGILDSGNAVSFNATATGGTGSYTYAWTFGDGGTSAVNPTGDHTYASEGLYNVTLTVTSGSQSAVWYGTVLVNDPQLLITGFSGTPTSGHAPLTVNFAAAATGGDGSFTFDFPNYGDGTSGVAASHIYGAKGTYTAVLRVQDGSGHTAYSYLAIQVGDPLLTVDCTSFSPGKTGLTYNFNNVLVAGGTGTYAYSWDFGDGTGSTLPMPTHQYPNTFAAFIGPASYTPMVTVTSGDQTITCTLNPITTAPADYPVTVEPVGVVPNPVALAGCGGPATIVFSINVYGGTPPYAVQGDARSNGVIVPAGPLPAAGPINFPLDVCAAGIPPGNYVFTWAATDAGGTTTTAMQSWSVIP